MKTFIYHDNSAGKYVNGVWLGNIIFLCKANSIKEADIEFKKSMGIDPIKSPHIGCEIKESGT